MLKINKMQTPDDVQILINKFGKFLKFKDFEIKKEASYEQMYKQIRSGAILQLKDGAYAIVGSVNCLLGVCDDCKHFGIEDISKIAYLSDIEIES